MPVFEQLYTQKCHQLNQLNENFIAYQDEATKIIEQLQTSNQELKRKHERFETEFSNERDKRNMQINLLQKELKFIKKEKHEITCKYEDLQKNFISQENIFETIQSENRAANYMLNQYEARVEKTMEELALLQIQLQESRQQSQELISRLKSQLRETQGQLYALQLKYQKHNQQSELRRSGSSSTSGESNEEINQISHQNDFFKLKPMNLNLLENIGIQKKREHSFMRTMNIVKNFISQFDEKTGKIKEKVKLSKRVTRA